MSEPTAPWTLSPHSWDREDYNLFELFNIAGVNSTRLYMLVLYGLIRSNGWKVLVELGGFRGNTTAILARAAHKNGGVVHVYEAEMDHALLLMDRFLPNDHVHVHHGRSQDAQPLASPVDFVFVDSEHTYTGALGDIRRWAPHVAPGGCMAFHDVTTDPEIRRAVYEGLTPSWRTLLFPGDAGLLLALRVG